MALDGCAVYTREVADKKSKVMLYYSAL